MRRALRRRALVAALLASPVTACSPGAHEGGHGSATRQQAVVGGTAAPGDTAVVALVARRVRCAEPAPLLLCSGALVAPDVVLTAAHCLEAFGVDGQYEVFLGEELLPEPRGRFVRVVQAVRHPGYEPRTHALDVALLRLATPVEVPPLALPGPGEVPEVGATARVVGYGDTRDATQPAGRRRQGDTVITEVRPAALLAGPAPAMSCTGDSGGPVLLRLMDGREVLAGVTVSGDVACRSEAVAVRVDAVQEDFLRPFLAAAPPPATAPLEPGALCAARCNGAQDCPAGLACVPDAAGEGRCMLLALREGDFGALCTDDATCGGGTCARLEPEGEASCRCFRSCTALGAPGAPGATGCAVAAGSLAPLALLALALGRRRRGALLPPG